ncbi:MAG: alpha/beta fold hydrolase [Proteobacteria bacterium]|nr:MAG: alpha/beta fold hydrolase [Pseudomonadota bacterium]
MSEQRKKVTFQGSQGELVGLLTVPDNPKAYVLFAHCFTCGKDVKAASYISRALSDLGFAVLRFDFTGLGGSDGDFANTNFSSNVQDIIAAADFLRDKYQAPQVLIGHSFGGTAVLRAAAKIPEAEALVTIAAPAEAHHIAHLIDHKIPEIEAQGSAQVNISGRPFNIKKQFIADWEKHGTEHIGQLKKALLVMHSPTDTVVSIDEAGKIFTAAMHPKSFFSLDGADHLLSRQEDANYAAGVISGFVAKFIGETAAKPKPTTAVQGNQDLSPGQVQVQEDNHKFTCRVATDSHSWLADEPKKVGGDDRGPDPYAHILAALGACTVMTMRMYANRKKWPLEDSIVTLQHSREHAEDCQDCDNKNAQIDVINRQIKIIGDDLDDEQRARLMEIADRCPVHRTLHNKIDIRSEAV